MTRINCCGVSVFFLAVIYSGHEKGTVLKEIDETVKRVEENADRH